MLLYKKYEESLNNELFYNTPGLIEIKMGNELIQSSGVNQEIVQEVFQTGMQVSEGKSEMRNFSVSYFPIKSGFKVEAILLLFPKENRENEFDENIVYLEKLALAGCNWVGISIENERQKKEYELVKVELTKLFSILTQPFCLVSRDGVIQEINDHLASVVQKRRSILIGEKVSQILTNDSWDIVKQQT
ncbi:hypothetical protein ACFOU2_16440 [Bacillus songklensis]|uniref:PAS domain-containing protein n=1 Tax=Bacillus songklensis TaxID=1069116 RepID=A0ABV8B6K0_9BACI